MDRPGKDDDKEFEKFLMASISGSEGTSALNTGREKKAPIFYIGPRIS